MLLVVLLRHVQAASSPESPAEANAAHDASQSPEATKPVTSGSL